MKNKLYILLIILSCNIIADEDDFIRDLPTSEVLALVTPEKFPTSDAVIILKDQSFIIQPAEIYYKMTFFGPQTVFNNVLIVKLFNETAIKKYGSFEFEYAETFGDEIPNKFEARVRVLKENGEVVYMDEDEIQRIVSSERSDGTPLSRKILFKVPNLVPGDVLQIEYMFANVLARTFSGIFYHNDRDFILNSNLYITLPEDEKFSIISLPKERIGNPKVEQISDSYGTGKTYSWNLFNLNEMPDEVFCLPFEDRSMITAFVIDEIFDIPIESSTWYGLGNVFFRELIEKGDIENTEIEKLGIAPELNGQCTFQNVEDLYTAIRKYFKLSSFNSLYPNSEGIKDLFETKKGDASDLTLIMYRILKKWGVNSKCIMIRDKRDGIYEKTITSASWFNRLGLIVKINNKENVYDFDRSICTKYSLPWYLSGINFFVVDRNGSMHRKMNSFSNVKTNVVNEHHIFSFGENFELTDSLILQYKGFFEENLRNEFYDSETNIVEKYFSSILTSSCFSKVDSLLINNFLDENEFKVTSSGLASIKPEIIDSFIIINFKNIVLKEFKEKIYTTFRKTDLVFNGPFQINIKCEINIPEGFYLYSKNDEININGPENSISKIIYSLDEDKISLNFDITFPKEFIKMQDYPNLIQFLDSSLINLEKDILFKRI